MTIRTRILAVTAPTLLLAVSVITVDAVVGIRLEDDLTIIEIQRQNELE